MAKVKSWKNGEAGEPAFPEDFEIVQKAVLQVTDFKSNHNKYYAIELHSAGKDGGKGGAAPFRVFTHYGRTDDLEKNPDSGQKECRYLPTLPEARACYQQIYKEKTGPAKGYKELSLASSKIGSAKARGTSAGEVDAKTIEKLNRAKADAAKAEANGDAQAGAARDGGAAATSAAPADPTKPPPLPKVQLHPAVADLVRYVYAEATDALTTTVAAKITAHGIETPLGILTIGQIEKGEKILMEVYDLLQKSIPSKKQEKLRDLSGDFYTVIPHRIGRTREAIASAVIDSLDAFGQKQETLQLMKDMLQVNGDAGSVLFDAQVESQYYQLKCGVGFLDRESPQYRQLADYVIKSQLKSKDVKVQNVYTLIRPGEYEGFTADIPDQRLLFHGSRIQNWVGILSRGILMPKVVVSMGGKRTDAGWLGNGIYFGDAACTSAFYTTPGRKKTRLMAVARVALGQMKDYTKITYGLTAPPPGFHSCHGVRHTPKAPSQFADDEYVIYDPRQHRLEYLVEFTA